jgi:hypothetical protein
VSNNPVAPAAWTVLREAAGRAQLHRELQALVLDGFELDPSAKVKRSLVYAHVASRLGRVVSNRLCIDICEAVFSLPGVALPTMSNGRARFRGLKPKG